MRDRFFLGVIALALAIVHANDAKARTLSASKIGVAGDAGGLLSERTHAELDARGFATVALSEFDPMRAPEPRVDMIVVVDADHGRVSVWQPAEGSAPARFRTAIQTEDGSLTTTAVRVAERVRALATSSADGAPSIEAAAPETTAAIVSPTPRDAVRPAPRESRNERPWRVGGELAIMTPAGLASPYALGSIRGSRELGGGFRLGARAWAPLSASSVARADDSADIWASAIALDGSVALIRPERALGWELSVGGGAGLLWLHMRGASPAPGVAQTDDLATGIGFGAMDISYPMSPGLRAHLSGLVGATFPSAGIRFGGERVTRWGEPLASTSLGIDFVF